MAARRIRTTGVVLAIALIGAACGGGSDEDAAASSTSGPPTTAAATTTTIPAPTTAPGPTTTTEPPPPPLPDPAFAATAAPADAGAACIGTREGLSCLDEDGWTTWTADDAPIRGWVRSLDFCDDGSLVVPQNRGVALLRDGRWSEIPVDFSNSAPDHVVCDGDRIVAAFFGTIAIFEEGAWTAYESEAVLGTGTLLKTANDIAVGSDGSVWVVTSSSIARLVDGEWTFWEEGRGFEERIRATAVAVETGADGEVVPRVYIDNTGLATLTEGEWTIAPPKEVGVDTMVAADGALWVPLVNTGVGEIVNGVVTEYGVADGLSTDRVDAIAVDDGGRVWAGTSYGLSILGDGPRTYRMDNSDLVNNDVSAIAVRGAGPGLPADDPRPWSTLTARLVDDGDVPLVGRTIEICIENVGSRFDGPTPCSGQVYTASAVTDDQGIALFEYVRAGSYVIAVEGDEGWLMVGGSTNEEFIVPAGQLTEVGDIVLSGPEPEEGDDESSDEETG